MRPRLGGSEHACMHGEVPSGGGGAGSAAALPAMRLFAKAASTVIRFGIPEARGRAGQQATDRQIAVSWTGIQLLDSFLMADSANSLVFGLIFACIGAAFTEHGFRLYACAFLVMGVSIYSSGFFTALGNGKVSALISFLRTFLFEAGCVLLLPTILGADGIWLAIDVAECASVIISLLFVLGLRRAYGYSLRPF